MTTRRAMMAMGVAMLPVAALSTTGAPTRIFEWTFLKSHAADPAALAGFIRANWFVMDAQAVAQGLMTGFTLHLADDRGVLPDDWNVVVSVGYPDPRGYAGIATAFEAIRRDHVVIDGPVSRHGRIVGTRRLLPESSKVLT